MEALTVKPILVKLQRAIDATSILENRTLLKLPVFDLSPVEQKVGSISLKKRRARLYSDKNYSCIYLIYGKLVNYQFQHSGNFPPNLLNTSTQLVMFFFVYQKHGYPN